MALSEIIAELPRAVLEAEVAALPASDLLVPGDRLRVYCTRAEQIPGLLQEIGRLREVTFRAVGEGTGKCADIDLFDAYYLHLFVWDARASAVVGAYRLGLVDQILQRYGKRGLYTYTLFKYGAGILDSLNPGIELGRSFVRAEYQRSFAPLLLLWRGIACLIEQAPRYAMLFGPVSISKSYAPASRRLMVAYLSSRNADPRFAGAVTPRRPYRDTARRPVSDAEVASLGSIEELSHRITLIEQDGKGLPVLLRQYLRLGGRLLGFNVDRRFGNALDGLLLVDLRRTELAVLARYMGEPGTRTFCAYHSAMASRSAASGTLTLAPARSV